jgi:gliding motility-associated-like protein
MANWKWYGKIWAFIGWLFITHVDISPQSLINLIPNPSFEEGIECLDHPVPIIYQINSPIELVDYWFNSNGYCHYKRNYYTSPNCNDFDRILVPAGNTPIPNIIQPYQYPYDGDAFVTLLTYNTWDYFFIPELNPRSNIGVQLIEPLQVGKKYHLKLHTNLINTATHSSYLTILFSNQYFYKDTFDFYQHQGVFITPQIIIPNVNDTMNWVPFETWFYADSAYQYMYIGNFLPDSLSNLTQLKPIEEWPFNSFHHYAICSYNVDGVLLEEVEELPLPNVISPNGDGLNDAWVVPEPVTPMQLRIYNRWGNLVYESENYANNWSGETMQGEKVTDGTYFYILTMPHAPPKKGFIQVFGE